MRSDGRYLKNMDPMYKIASHIMTERSDAMNMIELDIPLEPIQKYLNEKRKQGIHISHLAIVLAAYVRVLAEYPQLNRFIVNKRVYARNHISVCMVVLKPGNYGDETEDKMYFDPADDIFAVNQKVIDYVEKNRQQGDVNEMDKVIKILTGIPGLLNIGVRLLKLMDRYGIMPKAIIEASPFHCSMVISNLASLRTNHIFHHVYNFGTTSMVLTIGNSREVPMRRKGEIEFVKCMPFGVVMDERICTGSYYALAFKRMKEYLSDPAKMETPPKVVNEDVK